MKFGTYLYFNGNASEAIDFYCELFDVERPEIQTYGEIPPTDEHQLPEETKNKILYAKLDLDGNTFYFTDNLPGYETTIGNNISVVLDANTEDEFREMYHYLRQEGEVIMEPRETFFSEKYTRVRDRFGIFWEINYNGFVKNDLPIED